MFEQAWQDVGVFPALQQGIKKNLRLGLCRYGAE